MIGKLPPYPVYKHSGADWLGVVPAHWRITQLRRGAKLTSGRSPTQVASETGRFPIIGANGPIGWSKQSNVTDGIAVGRVGSSGLVRHINAPSWISDNALFVEPDSASWVPRYLYHALSSAQLSDLATQTAQPLITQQALGRKAIPAPPISEQSAIARFLNHADRRIQRFISAKEKLIKLLEEQKQAVIHEAVTGKIDVRTGKPYPAYKDSGVDWLGEVPEHWDVRRLKNICSMQAGHGITAQSIETEGEYPVYGGNGRRGFNSKYTHDGDFVLIGRQGALCGNVHVARGRFWASEHAVVASLNPQHHINWFAEILTAMKLNQYSVSAAQPGLSVEKILNLRLPLPPEQEQQLIADRLNRASTDADVAISQAQRQVELLNEYRTRLIADVVTGKFDVREPAERLPEMDGLVASERHHRQSEWLDERLGEKMRDAAVAEPR